MFDNLKTDDSVQQETDVLGGNGPLDSGVYPATIKMAYLDQSAGGAHSLVCTFDINGRELRQTFWMTSGTKKGCKNYYENQEGERHYLPGFIAANHISMLTNKGMEIGDLCKSTAEEKVIKLYSYETKKEEPTKKQVVVGLLNAEITLGVMKHKVDKTQRGEDGGYHPTGETREINEVEKIFRTEDGKTVGEIRNQAEEATFINSWRNKWAGEVRDKTNKDGAKAGAPGAAAAPAAEKPTQSLFG